MGFSGNSVPSYIFPTLIATNEGIGGKSGQTLGAEDLNFHIGDDGVANSKTFAINYPVRHGIVDNWTHMEKFWQNSIFKYLRAEPEDHYFLLVLTLFCPLNPYFMFLLIYLRLSLL